MDSGWWVAARLPPEIAGGRQRTTPPDSERVLKTREPTNCLPRTVVLLHCGGAVGGWSLVGGWVVGALDGASGGLTGRFSNAGSLYFVPCGVSIY